MADRKKSPLGGRGPAGGGAAPEPPAEETPAPTQLEAPTPPPPPTELRRPAPVTRNPRRLRVVGKVTDDDLVSFNCKMSRGLRRAVRHFAADAEVDIQDVVAAALEEYLQDRGIAVPGVDQRQPG
ncbi:hypothetical protein [Amycolatopsis sp. NPDC051903]|uniref:hypothetical protein n=1 Tax=Amycolatopsis sp. NPDC051903 TaxID=3363936 RepID=UPI0037877A64